MPKTIKLTDPKSGADYTLEYDRDSVKYAESIGFDMSRAQTSYATDVVTLFRAAFHKNHPFVPDATIDGIWDRLPGKQDVLPVLMDMFAAPYNALLAEPEETDPKETPTLQVVGD